ncbi:TetR/AcrR family transcriptional regulator [Shimia abyssi]|uniref:TetR family transcriptional regulator n=1 Tax=Shimia abyssi TaxID=1662395 RepID=A0A2P8FFL7_9RHOB|nr:TetR/AcrR family transcriptional regulator [Shimia abyssi]PSL20478.1 TetR family transcriptional regulator [Shimia abyssi]
MRTRLSKSERRLDILNHAQLLFTTRGFAESEMEEIRLACGISRGGLYHHFSNKRAVLDALVMQEVSALVPVLADGDSPISALIYAGSNHLNEGQSLRAAFQSTAEKLEYLSALERAFTALLRQPLATRLVGSVVEGVNADHVAELFLIINGHINLREILGEWSPSESASFAATSLRALCPLLKAPSGLDQIIKELQAKAHS